MLIRDTQDQLLKMLYSNSGDLKAGKESKSVFREFVFETILSLRESKTMSEIIRTFVTNNAIKCEHRAKEKFNLSGENAGQ